MDVSKPIASSITSISFSYLSSNDIRKVSVKQATNPQLFDNLNMPSTNGLYDPAYGPLTRGDMYVVLPFPIFSSFSSPGLFANVFDVGMLIVALPVGSHRMTVLVISVTLNCPVPSFIRCT